jgi:hypothetical protein
MALPTGGGAVAALAPPVAIPVPTAQFPQRAQNYIDDIQSGVSYPYRNSPDSVKTNLINWIRQNPDASHERIMSVMDELSRQGNPWVPK